MGEYLWRSERVGEVAVMEVGHGGVKTRAMEVTSSDSSKKRKTDSRQLLQSWSSNVRLVNCPRNSISPATSGNSNRVPLSLCSSSESRSLDLKAEGLETEISMFITGGFSRETTPSTELWSDSDEMESSSTTKKQPSPASSRRKSPASKMPPPAEIEEFFSAAEKYEQKRFADKYNYDIVKDVPLDGRYQWFRLKQ